MDTAGSEQFRSIRRGYYANCSFALIVYDITNQDSFNDVKDWINDCKNYANSNIHMVLVGNKIDLAESRKISTEEGTELANKYNMDFFECSAMTGENIESIFLGLCEYLSYNMDKGKYDLNNPSSGISEETILENELKINKTFVLNREDNDNEGKNKSKKKCCF